MMKKLSIFFVVIALLFSLTGCGKGHNKLIKKAVDEVKHNWEHTFSSLTNENDGHFEIKNTRIVTIKENTEKTFKDVSYIIEFEIYTDVKGTAPYYLPATTYNSVTVYKDGKMEVRERNLLTSSVHLSKNGYDYSNVIESVKDYGSKYNCTETFKKK